MAHTQRWYRISYRWKIISLSKMHERNTLIKYRLPGISIYHNPQKRFKTNQSDILHSAFRLDERASDKWQKEHREPEISNSCKSSQKPTQPIQAFLWILRQKEWRKVGQCDPDDARWKESQCLGWTHCNSILQWRTTRNAGSIWRKTTQGQGEDNIKKYLIGDPLFL